MTKAPKIVGNAVRLFADGDTINTVLTTAKRARASNVATITTAVAHGLFTGAIVAIAGLGGTGYANATATITVTTTTAFTYANTGTDESETTDTAGTVTQSGTASRTVRPGADDAKWSDLGIIEDLSIDRSQTGDEIYAPNPGKIELYDVIETKVVNGLKFTTAELSAKVYEVLFAAAAFTSETGSYTPNAKVTKKFWVEVKQYDQTDTLINTVYLYCYVSINGDVKFGPAHVTASWECKKLVSSLNAGTLV